MYGGATALRIWQSRNTRHLARDEQWTGYSIDKGTSACLMAERLWCEAWVAERLELLRRSGVRERPVGS